MLVMKPGFLFLLPLSKDNIQFYIPVSFSVDLPYLLLVSTLNIN